MGSQSFSYTGGWQTFNVPTGVTSIDVTIQGAGGYSALNAGRVVGTIHVADTDTLYIVIGQEGLSGVNGGSGTHSNAGGGATFGAGGAGGAGYNANGGDSGGGYSGIRLNSTSGTIKCIAAGGAGDSGDGGAGGAGGTNTGASGGRGNAGSGATTAATGGTQSSGGNGGTSSSGGTFAGGSASDSVVARAGTGGDTGSFDGPGGGGGGGGYHSGGGGQGGSSGWAPGGGGGGGSNYTGGMSAVSENSRNGNGGPGNLTLSWTDPDLPPATPNISAPAVALRTSAIGTVALTASVSSPPVGSTETRLKVLYDTDSAFGSPQTVYSGYRTTSGSLTVNMTSLSSNSRYYVRAYAQGNSGLVSSSYDTTNFYTDFAPNVPTSVGPSGSTRSMGSVTLTAVLSDADGNSVRANFQHDDNSSFSTPTSISSGYVASGGTGTASVTGLLTDTQYWVRAQAQDSPGLTSAYSAGVSFWTNRTPLAPILTQPFSGEAFDSTIAQTFTWTFNDPDSGDSQSAATLQYRAFGSSDPWTTVSLTTTTSNVFAANTFSPGVTYEWQVQTTDAGGLTGPFSASSTFVGSPPVVNMTAQGGLSISAVDTISQTSAMVGQGGLTITPSVTESPTVALTATAGMTITPVQTIGRPVPISAQASMAIVPAVTKLVTLAMAPTAGMTIVGGKSVPAVVGFVATGAILFQAVNGEVLMKGTAGMTVLANSITIQATQAMGVSAAMAVTPDIQHPGTSVMAAVAGMALTAVVTKQASVGMAVRASVSDSPGLSRIVPMVMSVRAQIAVSPLLTHPRPVAISAVAGMTVAGFDNHLGAVAFSAQGSMAVTGHDTLPSGDLPMGASAAMNINGVRSFTNAVAMSGSAGIVYHQVQFTFDRPYLITTDSHGDTLTFTRVSDPIPSKVTNEVSISNTGNVTP